MTGDGFKTDARRREQVNRARRLRRAVARGFAPNPDPPAVGRLMEACPGCGRRFPASTLVRGLCGGDWCPAGARVGVNG